MTTVAYRDGVLAADTAVFDCGVYVGQRRKIHSVPGNAFLVAAGCVYDIEVFRQWYRARPDTPPRFGDEDFEAAIVGAGGATWYGVNCLPVDITADFFAFGSGFRLALGALHAGADALRAVEIACLDCYTQAPVDAVRVADGVWR